MGESELKVAFKAVFNEYRDDMISEAKAEARKEVNAQVNEIAEVFGSQINIEFKTLVTELNDNINKLYLDNRQKVLNLEVKVDKFNKEYDRRLKVLEERDMMYAAFVRHGWKIITGLVLIIGAFVIHKFNT